METHDYKHGAIQVLGQLFRRKAVTQLDIPRDTARPKMDLLCNMVGEGMLVENTYEIKDGFFAPAAKSSSEMAEEESNSENGWMKE